MGTVYGVNKTKARNPVGENILDPGLFGGRVRVMLDSFECSSLDIAEVIEMGGTLPKGARVIEIILNTDDLGGSVTLDVGDYEDPNRYIDGAGHSSATTTRLIAYNTVIGVGYKVDESDPTKLDSQIIVTIGVAAATGTINIAILYTVD